MNISRLTSTLIGLMQHHPFLIADNPMPEPAFAVANDVNASLNLHPGGDEIRVYATPGDTFLVIRISEIPANLDLLETNTDPRHLPEIQSYIKG